MKTYSPKWLSSIQPRKQRKYRYNAPLHRRQKMMSAHLDKALRRTYATRAVPLRKGDEVRVMRGEHRGRSGKISAVDLKHLKIYVENIKVKKPSGQEVEVALDPSNVMITKLELEDKKRMRSLSRKKKGKKAEKQETTEVKSKEKKPKDVSKEKIKPMEATV